MMVPADNLDRNGPDVGALRARSGGTLPQQAPDPKEDAMSEPTPAPEVHHHENAIDHFE